VEPVGAGPRARPRDATPFATATSPIRAKLRAAPVPAHVTQPIS